MTIDCLLDKESSPPTVYLEAPERLQRKGCEALMTSGFSSQASASGLHSTSVCPLLPAVQLHSDLDSASAFLT